MNFPDTRGSVMFSANRAGGVDAKMTTQQSMVRSILIACAALTLVPAGLEGSAAAREDKCVRGDGQVRRIEIAVEDSARGVPCEVVYWKDTEEPGVRRVLWSARTDAGFCKSKADELVAKLEAVGWTCTPADQAVEQAGPSTPPAATPPVTTNEATSPPEQAAPPDQATRDQEEVAPDIKEALAPQHSAEPPVPATTATPPAVATTTSPPAADALAVIIEQNLARLNEGVDGDFDALVADYGDLNGDGYQDGLVLFTYESQRLGQARFIGAYLFDGETYALAATKPLTGGADRLKGAEIESVDGGVISIRLNILEPGDAACCPSGVHRQALILRNGELIEVNATAPNAENRS